MGYTIDYSRINWKRLFYTWNLGRVTWCLESKYDDSLISQLKRHYWEQLNLLGATNEDVRFLYR